MNCSFLKKWLLQNSAPGGPSGQLEVGLGEGEVGQHPHPFFPPSLQRFPRFTLLYRHTGFHVRTSLNKVFYSREKSLKATVLQQ